MSANLKDNERQLLRLITSYKKRAEILKNEGRLSEEQHEIMNACYKVEEALLIHSDNRAEVQSQRELLKTMIQDNAECPQCNKSSHLKLRGPEENDRGWKCNTYSCKRCNIEFTWNRPNNPWDMIPFIEESIGGLLQQMENEPSEERKELSKMVIEQMSDSLKKLKPVIASADNSYNELQRREEEIERVVREFKKVLMIEKIKMEG